MTHKPAKNRYELLAEYKAIRREYNKLNRNNPAHATRRAELRMRYFELDRQYAQLTTGAADPASVSIGGRAARAAHADAEALIRRRQEVQQEAEEVEETTDASTAAVPASSANTLPDPKDFLDWMEANTPVENAPADDAQLMGATQETEASAQSSSAESHQAKPQEGHPKTPDVSHRDWDWEEFDTPHDVDGSDVSSAEPRGSETERIAASAPHVSLPVPEIEDDDDAMPPLAAIEAELARMDPEEYALIAREADDAAPEESPEEGEAARQAFLKKDTSTCPRCKTMNPASHGRCESCGAPLAGEHTSSATGLSALSTLRTAPRPTIRRSIVYPILGAPVAAVGGLLVLSLVTGWGTGLAYGVLGLIGVNGDAGVTAPILVGLLIMLLGGLLLGAGSFRSLLTGGPDPLHELAQTGAIEELEAALKRRKNVDKRDDQGATPLHFAVAGGQSEAVALLIARGADKEARTDDGETPLYIAVSNQDLRMVDRLLEQGADLGTVNGRGSGLLHVAAALGDLDLLTLLRAHGLEPKVRNEEGYTALHFAAQAGHDQAVRLLVEIGADPDPNSVQGATPLYAAAKNGHLEVVKRLVNAGAGVNVKRGMYYHSPLSVAVENKREAVVEFLRARGAQG